MNAPIQKIAVITVTILLTGGVSACANAFNPATDATSPVAPRVQALVDANREYPRWADFPRSEVLPEPVAIAAQVNTLRVSAGSLTGEVSRIDWQTTGDPEVFAADVQSRIDATPVAPVTAETQAEMDAFIRRTRERGRAPPPVDRR